MNRRTMLCTMLVALAVCSSTGCARLRGYAANRGADLIDPFIFEATYGKGLELHAQLTGYFGLSLGVSTHVGPMIRGRHIGMGRRDNHGFLFGSETVVDYQGLQPIRGPRYPRRYDHREWFGFLPSAIYGESSHSYMPRWPENLNVEAGFSLYFVGLHIGLNPIELVDLLGGLILIDIAGDDIRPGRRESLRDYPTAQEYHIFGPPPSPPEGDQQ